MSTQGEIPIGDPMRDAWERYRLTDEYANTKRWALHPEHVDGSLWAAFAEGYDALTAELAAVSAIRWRKVSEGLPDEGVSVLVYDGGPGGHIAKTAVYRGEFVAPSLKPEITHWMPLPSPPSDTEPGTP